MDHLIDDEERPRRERELTLSTGAILGIFLGLAVLCGGFFGFGYNMGRKAAPTPLSLNDLNTEANNSLPVTTNAAKPAAGSPLDTTIAPPAVTAPKPVRKPAPAPVASDDDDDHPATAEPKTPATHTPAATTATSNPAPIVRQPAPIAPSALSPTTLPGTAAGGTYMVQVAAVSHKEDADLLLGALRARGYSVSARNGAGDNFIHVQVGPFRDKKDADAMRQRLITDGYNAIVKQ